MATVQIKKTYGDKSDGEIYEAAIQAIANAGYTVWKKRELARLVLGTGKQDGQEVRMNVVVNMVDNSATISAESDDLDKKALESVAEKIHLEMEKLLL